ncbi:unnamed protein product [Sphagnum jensenii]|uniref:Uncharacterized protein n=1 Tax=Sphagnum jensenii TaxID=128206 RepID=A0ABP1ALI7_9BRYO
MLAAAGLGLERNSSSMAAAAAESIHKHSPLPHCLQLLLIRRKEEEEQVKRVAFPLQLCCWFSPSQVLLFSGFLDKSCLLFLLLTIAATSSFSASSSSASSSSKTTPTTAAAADVFYSKLMLFLIR